MEQMEEKIKILVGMDVYLPDVDGVVNCVHNYCLNLNDRADINVIVPKNKKGYVDKFPYKIHRCKSIHVPILNDYYGLPELDTKFKKEVNEIDPDIVYIHSPFNMAKYGLKLAKKKNIPAVATFHSNMRPIFRSLVKSDWIAEQMVKNLGKTYNKFDEVFVCSPIVGEQLRSYGYTGKITYQPLGTELEKCTNIDELKKQANEEFGIQEDENVLIYVGRVMKLKRIDFILESLKKVKDKGIKFKFYVVGKGAELEKLKKLAKKLEFTDDEVIFTGFLERRLFPLINARADLLLFPSIYDTFGLVKVEAAAYSTPGVFVENTCAGYGVEDGVNGFLSKDDTTDFADKIIEALSNKQKLAEIGKKASDDLYINWKDCSDRVYERLSEIVRESKQKKLCNAS